MATSARRTHIGINRLAMRPNHRAAGARRLASLMTSGTSVMPNQLMTAATFGIGGSLTGAEPSLRRRAAARAHRIGVLQQRRGQSRSGRLKG
jgi:hypothetical protein